jgi:hypothetical protein
MPNWMLSGLASCENSDQRILGLSIKRDRHRAYPNIATLKSHYHRVERLITRENLENQPSSRENRPLIAGQDWIDGRQAAGFW